MLAKQNTKDPTIIPKVTGYVKIMTGAGNVRDRLGYDEIWDSDRCPHSQSMKLFRDKLAQRKPMTSKCALRAYENANV